jgi:hypothetical protein
MHRLVLGGCTALAISTIGVLPNGSPAHAAESGAVLAQPEQEEPTPHASLAEFESDSPSLDPLSGIWRTVNDNIMGGRSEGGGVIRDGVMIFSGSTNTNGGGFSSVRAGDRDWDLSEYDGIAARVRADGRTYVFHLQAGIEDGKRAVFYRGEFETRAIIDAEGRSENDKHWQIVYVPFKEFDPFIRGRNLRGQLEGLNPGDIRSIGLMIDDGLDGPFRLDADWIRAVTADNAPTDETI